jgi:DnaK suppressor protein
MAAKISRNDQLRQILTERRAAVQEELQSRIRDGRGNRTKEVRDDAEHSDVGIQGDIALTLLQLSSDTLARIDAALARLDAGTFGSCVECEDDISEKRLRALPFALRCQACEQKREQELGPARRRAQRVGGLSLFPEATGS